MPEFLHDRKDSVEQRTDASSGERYLRLPLPDLHRVQVMADALAAVLASAGAMPIYGAAAIAPEEVPPKAQRLADAAR